MITRIKNELCKQKIARWRINAVKEESAELFFVKHALDTRRIKDTVKYRVTVFRSGEGTVGATEALILPSMTEEEITGAIADAYFAASFAQNPAYDAPDAVRAETVSEDTDLVKLPLTECACRMAEAIMAADSHPHAFLNSAEIFCHRTSVRILSSEGTDVSYTDGICKGEYVVQCREGEDVELFDQFAYRDVNADALRDRITENISVVYDRACAQKVLKSGKYDLILSGENLATVLSYYAEKTSADMIYPHYSAWKVGEGVQGDVKGEAVTLSLLPSAPYSDDGIPTPGMNIVKDGIMTAVHGSTRFCRYLGIRPTGTYRKMRCENAGTLSLSEMKSGPCLYAVTFSDFQMDEMSGHFGGEIRLAYLIENGKVTPVTGGSVNGNLFEAQGTLAFTKERYVSDRFEGPYAARFHAIPVAGTEQ